MANEYAELKRTISDISKEIGTRLQNKPKLETMFHKCFINTAYTTVEEYESGSSYIFTGDIPAMWLRDSTVQVKHYLPFLDKSEEIRFLIKGLIKRQFMYINIDPYANAFNKEPNGKGHKEDITLQNDWVWERKYEIDSLCYPVQLLYKYWKGSDDDSVFTSQIKDALHTIIDLWKREQKHGEFSNYTFERFDCVKTDTLPNEGKGMPVNYTGMTWSGFRPSDDACTFGYLIPSNMFAVVVLEYMEEIARRIYKDTYLESKAKKLKDEIDNGIQTYGIYDHPKFGKIYAYETDGYGNYNLMDDANVPSLLSIPYLGYTDVTDDIYINTRNFILSEYNPYYFKGKYAQGIGSPHTPDNYIWHIALAMQALTATDEEEVDGILNMLITTDANTDYMHESFNADNPYQYTREWFAWANSLFAELVYKLIINDKI